MATMDCISCGRQIGSSLLSCPFCGAKNSTATRAGPSSTQVALLAVAAFVVVFLLALATFRWFGNEAANPGALAAQTSTVHQAARSPVPGLCGKSPTELFPVGAQFESDALAKLTDKECPNARYFPDEHFEVVFGSETFAIQTKKLNFTGPAFYEIVSVRTVPK